MNTSMVREVFLRDWPVLLYAAVIVLFPIGRSSELPVVLAAVAGVVVLWRDRQVLRSSSAHLALVLFLGFWLPTLLSAPDAVSPSKSWSTVGVVLRFAPFALLAVATLGPERLDRVYSITAAIALLWAVDALFQSVSGYSLGGELSADRVSGVFGAGNLKLGPVLAVLSPFAFDAVLLRYGRRAFVAAWAVIALAILLAGERAGWASFALVTVYYGWRVSASRSQFLLGLAGAIVLTAALGGAAYTASERFAARVDRTATMLGGNKIALNYALAGRLPIWRTALVMGAANPLNGVGVRGFRYAYPEYTRADDPWVKDDLSEGARHPHQIVLEVFAETGLLGLACWIVATLAAIRAWRNAAPDARARARAPALALVAMCFPFNTHFAFYSSYWCVFLWWLLALYCAALTPADRDA